MNGWYDTFEHEHRLWRQEAGRGDAEAPAGASIAALGDRFDSIEEEVLIRRLAGGDTPTFLFIIGDLAQLVATRADGAQFTYLGDLAGGRYEEVVRYQDAAVAVEGTFRHPRLPDGIELVIRSVTYQPGHRNPMGQRSEQRAARVQERLRRWAESPPPTAH